MVTIHGDSAAIADLFAALAAASTKFKPVLKEHTAKTEKYSYTYAKLEDAIEATRAGLAEHGLAVVQAPGRADGLVSVTTLLVHKGGAWIEAEVSASAPKADIQGIGSAISYLRRYALMAVLGLAAEDDDGQRAMPQAPPSPPLPVKDRTGTATPERVGERFKKLWFQKLQGLGMKLTDEQRHLIQQRTLGVESLAELSVDQMKKVGVELKEQSEEQFAEWCREILGVPATATDEEG